MDRLQKKCFIASAGFHLLLALILFVGPAFVPSNSRIDDLPLLDTIPWKTVDALVPPGGGNPKAGSPPPAQPQPPSPAPQPKPEKVPQPEPVKEVVKETKPEPEPSLEPSPESKPKKKPIELKPVVRNSSSKDEAKARAEDQARAEAKAAADARREVAGQLGRAADKIGNSLSGSTSVGLIGPGGGGVPYANFLQAVKSRYAQAWVVPDGVIDDNATTTVAVTIARDGTVTASRITQPSGDSVLDASVQVTLNRVRYAAPLPDNAKENERTVTIRFNVKLKRGTA